eukprot:CAMPEP_0117579432 /NCGR_PEP_ID=MMETSP0784-20121206/64612_1 /TAXON_ID=39447 /ORGANISM="" /LENGTH=58 /DNA_ID=CAMNT_0005379319 /DNA_START=1 /DNA_END=174 /DNA_ORIENTATION=-
MDAAIWQPLLAAKESVAVPKCHRNAWPKWFNDTRSRACALGPERGFAGASSCAAVHGV